MKVYTPQLNLLLSKRFPYETKCSALREINNLDVLGQ